MAGWTLGMIERLVEANRAALSTVTDAELGADPGATTDATVSRLNPERVGREVQRRRRASSTSKSKEVRVR